MSESINKDIMAARKDFASFAVELLGLGVIGQMSAFDMTRATLTTKEKEACYQHLIRYLARQLPQDDNDLV